MMNWHLYHYIALLVGCIAIPLLVGAIIGNMGRRGGGDDREVSR